MIPFSFKLQIFVSHTRTSGCHNNGGVYAGRDDRRDPGPGSLPEVGGGGSDGGGAELHAGSGYHAASVKGNP